MSKPRTACYFAAWGHRCSKREGHEGTHSIDLLDAPLPAEDPAVTLRRRTLALEECERRLFAIEAEE